MRGKRGCSWAQRGTCLSWPAQDGAASAGLNSDVAPPRCAKGKGISTAGWEALLEFRAGKWQDLSLEGQHPALSCISCLQGVWSFSASQVPVISHSRDLTPTEVRAAPHRVPATLPSWCASWTHQVLLLLKWACKSKIHLILKLTKGSN